MQRKRIKPNGNRKLVKNTMMLYVLNITKLVLPLVTLPYLTRVLSVDSYGVVTYIKSIMTYMQLLIDFGFILSATKDIVRAGDSKNKIGIITGNVIISKLILSSLSLLILLLLVIFIPILRENLVFTLLSFVTVFLTTFLLDFLFRGLEKMDIITYRYLIMKGLSTVLTFVFVKGDADLIFIPLLDIFGTLVAIIWINTTLRKLGIKILHGTLKEIFTSLKDSFSYFLSNIATTAFGALNTVVIGIVLTKSDIAYWSIILQIVNAVGALYSPIVDGIYPEMVRNQKIRLIFKILLFFTPFIILGCGIVYFGAGLILTIIGGSQYTSQAGLLKLTVPLLFFSFYSMLFGWPVLGSIDKVKETTISTIIACLFQVIGIFVLLLCNSFTLITLTILRWITELTLLIIRLFYCWKFRFKFKDFVKKDF